MEKINKLFVFAIIGVLSFAVGIKTSNAQEYINYNGIHMTTNEYNTLINLGFTEEQIYHMDEDTYESNKDLDAKLVSQTVRYYKTITPAYGTGYDVEITEEEYNNAVKDPTFSNKGVVDTTYKTITSSIAQNGSKYRYNVSTLWKQMPSTRSYDIIGIGFSGQVYISSSVYFSFTYANSSWNYTTSTQYYNKKSLSTGGAAVYKLPTGTIKALSASLYFDVSKSTSSTITSLAICGDYAHATSNVPVGNVGDYGISINGINLYSTIVNLYDATPCAMEYANVNW
jgi:hypothetical protein